jgi:hypothetical protein
MGLLERLAETVDTGVVDGVIGEDRQGSDESVRNGQSDPVRRKGGKQNRVGSESDGTGSQTE